eukprot:SAG11_NODE_566_length_8482_cov_13.445477_3_plen_101_part_00
MLCNGDVQHHGRTLTTAMLRGVVDGVKQPSPRVVWQGEGEAQICAVAKRYVEMLRAEFGFRQAMQAAITLVCADVDLLGGRLMPPVHGLLHWFGLVRLRM